MGKEETEASFSANHLIDNGLGALSFGVQLLCGSTEPDKALQVALREVSSGIELLIKGLLAREHWSLVFDEPSLACRKKFETGDFQSVGHAQCLRRLQNISGVSVAKKPSDDLRRLRTERNRFEHLGELGNLHALRARIGGALHATASLNQRA